MSWPHTPEQIESIMAQERTSPWIWMLEVEITDADEIPVGAVRVCNNPTALTWDSFGDGTAQTYSPLAFSVGTLEADSEGTLRSISVSASNATRDIQAVFEHYDGLAGEKARVFLVNADELDSVVPYWEAEGEVITSGADDQTATLQIGQVVLEDRRFPNQRVTRRVCRHWTNGDYGGTLCGYDVTRSGALQTCDGSYDGGNGCTKHGEEEADAGVAVLHPLRFGGFLGVPRKTGLGAT